MEQDLTLREALAEDRLDDFVRQEEDRGVERALALLITKRRVAAGKASSWLRLVVASSTLFDQAGEELIMLTPSQLGFSLLC